MGKDERGNPSNIVWLDDFRKRPRRPKKPPADTQGPNFDEATRDLHAAVSSTLKFIFLVRSQLGLPELI